MSSFGQVNVQLNKKSNSFVLKFTVILDAFDLLKIAHVPYVSKLALCLTLLECINLFEKYNGCPLKHDFIEKPCSDSDGDRKKIRRMKKLHFVFIKVLATLSVTK